MNKTGRNNPCLCGSGKKYKHCCGSLQKNAPSAEGGLAQRPDKLLQTALEHHQAGHLPQAEAIYRQILQIVPTHPDALYLSGLIAHENGESLTALELIDRAIRVNPISPFYYSLGNVFHVLGRLDEAVESFRKALKLTPEAVDVHLNLANTLRMQGKLDEAAESFRKALKLAPDRADAHFSLGNTLKAQGKLSEAIESLRSTLKLNPDHAEAYNNLGSVFQALGKRDEAVESFRKALLLNPGLAEAHNNMGNMLKDQNRLDEAAESFCKALSLNPVLAEAHNNLGSVLCEQGKLEDAVKNFHKALMLKPDFADAANNMGNALKKQNKPESAIACYREALKLNPGMVEAHSNLGNALRNVDPCEAAKSFHRALALDPDFADAHLGLIALDYDGGQFASAQTRVDRVLELKSEHPAAWAFLPMLRKMTQDDLAWAETAQRLLGNGLKSYDEMCLSYALGKYFDDMRQYQTAFGYYQCANQIKRGITGAFDRDGWRRRVDATISTCTTEVLRQRTGRGSDSRRPLFIVGMPRSGTSLTEQILASHPDVFGAGELQFWGLAHARLTDQPSWHCENQLLQDIAAQYKDELLRHSATALRVVDKMPGNFVHLGLIHVVFPQARILHLQRNPVDTCLSIHFQNFSSGHSYASDLDDLAFYYREYHRIMAHWRAVLPPEVFMDVPYESLVEDHEGWSRRIIEFAGLPWNDCCLNFHETERKVGTASNWQVRQRIYKTSKERWRNYEQFAGPLLPLLELAG